MAYEHKINREIVNGHYNINNPDRVETVDGEDSPISLRKDIKTTLPGKKFEIHMEDKEVSIQFDDGLTKAEIDTLNQTIQNHKDNV